MSSENIDAIIAALVSQNDKAFDRIDKNFLALNEQISAMLLAVNNIAVHAVRIDNVEIRINKVEKDLEKEIKKVSKLVNESDRRKEMSKTILNPVIKNIVTGCFAVAIFFFGVVYNNINTTALGKFNQVMHAHG